MKINLASIAIIFLMLTFIAVSGCSIIVPRTTFTPTATPTELATLTPSPTFTLTPSQTPTSTYTPTSTSTLTELPTRTPTVTVSCLPGAGKWQSHEQSSGIFPARLLTFQVIACKAGDFEVWAFPLPGELYLMMPDGYVPIRENKFAYEKAEGEGSVIVAGEFTSPTTCQGTITFTKGFFFVDFTLNREVVIPWTASPASE